MFYLIKVFIQVTQHMFLFILQYSAGLLYDLRFDMLPCISLCSQHFFPFNVCTIFIKQCIDFLCHKSFSDNDLLSLIVSFAACIPSFLISHIKCHPDIHIMKSLTLFTLLSLCSMLIYSLLSLAFMSCIVFFLSFCIITLSSLFSGSFYNFRLS